MTARTVRLSATVADWLEAQAHRTGAPDVSAYLERRLTLLSADDDRLARADHRINEILAQRNPEDAGAAAEIERALRDEGFETPSRYAAVYVRDLDPEWLDRQIEDGLASGDESYTEEDVWLEALRVCGKGTPA